MLRLRCIIWAHGTLAELRSSSWRCRQFAFSFKLKPHMAHKFKIRNKFQTIYPEAYVAWNTYKHKHTTTNTGIQMYLCSGNLRYMCTCKCILLLMLLNAHRHTHTHANFVVIYDFLKYKCVSWHLHLYV